LFSRVIDTIEPATRRFVPVYFPTESIFTNKDKQVEGFCQWGREKEILDFRLGSPDFSGTGFGLKKEKKAGGRWLVNGEIAG
jgi:hypothetical protein